MSAGMYPGTLKSIASPGRKTPAPTSYPRKQSAPTPIARAQTFVARNMTFVAQRLTFIARNMTFVARNLKLIAQSLNLIAQSLKFNRDQISVKSRLDFRLVAIRFPLNREQISKRPALMCAFAHENQIIAQQKPMSSEKDFNFAGKNGIFGHKKAAQAHPWQTATLGRAGPLLFPASPIGSSGLALIRRPFLKISLLRIEGNLQRFISFHIL